MTIAVDKPVMATRPLVIVAILAAGLQLEAQTSRQRSAPAGVLIGIHTTGGYEFGAGPPVPASLRTVWLDTEGSVLPTLPHLLVPRSSGFWWLGLTSACSEEPRDGLDDATNQLEIDIIDMLWAAPINRRPIVDASDTTWKCLSADVRCATRFATGIYWVWPDFISLNRGRESGCGAHPDGDYRPAMHRLDDLDTPLSVGAAFGSIAEARLRSAYERETREYRSRRADGCDEPDAFSPTAWHIERRDGRWLLEGWAGTHRMCEVGISYTADSDLSRVTGSRARARPSGSIAGLDDAIVSPDERWILRIRRNEVALSPREAAERPVAMAALTRGESVVMAEWAQGSNVARWRDQMRTLSDAARGVRQAKETLSPGNNPSTR